MKLQKVYGDRFVEVLKEAHKEMKEKEETFSLDESGELLYFDSDIILYDELANVLKTIIAFLENDEVRGNTAMLIFREKVVDGPYQDLYYRLVESREVFPKVWDLYEYEQGVES